MSSPLTPTAPAATASDPLSQLRDLHAPPPIDWWPPAPGWWLLLAIVLAVAIGAGLWYRRRRQRHAYRRHAREELDNLRRTQGASVAALNALLKRTALQIYGRDAVAHLHGDAWVAFLRRQCPALGSSHQSTLDALTCGPYTPDADQPATAELLAACGQWLDQHRLQLQVATAPLPGASAHADT